MGTGTILNPVLSGGHLSVLVCEVRGNDLRPGNKPPERIRVNRPDWLTSWCLRADAAELLGTKNSIDKSNP